MNKNKFEVIQNYKVIISEIIMVLAVVFMVVILAFIVSGYWVNSNFEVERQGLLQVSSVPTGADITIDGESSWLQRTNTSKLLSSGEHTILLTKDGYDSWQKTINISEGLLYRLRYPRLFLNDRSIEKAYQTTGFTFATTSPNGASILLTNETSEWILLNLTDEKLDPKKINLTQFISSVDVTSDTEVGVFSGSILSADWANDNSHVLLKIQTGENIEWVIIDTNNPKNSINLSKEFGSNFDTVKIVDDSANNLLALQDQNLRKIDVANKQISAIISDNIITFDLYHDDLVLIKKEPKDYTLNLAKINNNSITKLTDLETPAKVAISKFYDDKYITIVQNSTVSLYKFEKFAHQADFGLSFTPNNIEVGGGGEFIVMSAGSDVASLDMEAIKIIEWRSAGERINWLDADMIYSVNGGELSVYDFDGLNHRILAKNVSSYLPATITDNKWLYYFSDNVLMREWLIPR